MKLAVITDEISMDISHALDVMKEFGAYGAELRSVWDKNLADLPDDDIVKIKQIIEDKGASVCAIASPFFKCEIEGNNSGGLGMTHQAQERTMADQKALLERLFKLADIFNTNLIRVFSFWRRGEMTPELQQRIIDSFQEPLAMAEKAGKILALENEHACYLGTGVETAEVLRKVNSPWLRAVWDPGNAFCLNEIPYPDGYNAIRDFIVHVHIKDAYRDKNGKPVFTLVGKGEIDYAGQFKALKADGYNGWISLETHWKPEGGSKEEGSRQCLLALKNFIEAD